MNERLRLLRKTLDLTLEEFGKRVGVTRSAIGRIEKGERNVTEQMAKSICREFRVNYFWLTEGEGEMFVGTPENIIDEIAEEYSLDEDDKELVKKYLGLPPEQRKILREIIKKIII